LSFFCFSSLLRAVAVVLFLQQAALSIWLPVLQADLQEGLTPARQQDVKPQLQPATQGAQTIAQPAPFCGMQPGVQPIYVCQARKRSAHLSMTVASISISTKYFSPFS